MRRVEVSVPGCRDTALKVVTYIVRVTARQLVPGCAKSLGISGSLSVALQMLWTKPFS